MAKLRAFWKPDIVKEANVLRDGTVIETLESGTVVVHNETTVKRPIKEKIYGPIFPEHFNSFEIKQLDKWMRPNGMSQDGFLAKREHLLTVVEEDRKTLEKHGITYDQIGDGLAEIVKAVNDAPYEEKNIHDEYCLVINDMTYIIKQIGYMGSQECPFERLEKWDEYKQANGSSDYYITNKTLGKTLFMAELHPHLIKYHHFFEGHTKYRLEPVAAMELLGLIK